MTAQFLVLDAQGSRVVPLGSDPLTIGREPGTGTGLLALKGRDISRRHCRVEAAPRGGHRVVDLYSTNGCWLNDNRFETMELSPFDRLRLGEATLVYLDTRTDPKKVLALLGRPQSETRELSALWSPGSLRDELLGLLLLHQEPSEGGEIRALLNSALDQLRELLESEYTLLLVQSNGAEDSWARFNRGRDLGSEDDLAACLRWAQESIASDQVCRKKRDRGTTVVVPIKYRPCVEGAEPKRRTDRVRGALLLGPSPQDSALGVEEEQLLRAFGRQLALFFLSARLHRRATVDTLTELSTRGPLEEALTAEVSHAQRQGCSLSVVLIDVDDFKAVNDTQGHQVGDDVLRGLGTILKASLRADDLACRWGGEEFLLMLPATDAEGALVVANKAVRSVAAKLSAGDRPITISAGVAAFPIHGRTTTELVACADKALYVAKRSGKNRACVYVPGLSAFAGVEELDLGRTMRRTSKPPRAFPPQQAAVAWLLSDTRPAIPLAPGRLSFGRSDMCDVVLPHRSVSRSHAIIGVEEGAITLEDRSSNGTQVNGRAVRFANLRAGDWIVIGPYAFEVAPQASRDSEETLSGDLLVGTFTRHAAPGLMIRLESLQCTGSLTVPDGELVLRKGKPVSARLGNFDGVDALARMCLLQRGAYVFRRGEVPGSSTLPVSLAEIASRPRRAPGT